MPNIYTDQFFVIDPFLGLTVGTAMSVINYDMVDQNDNGDIEPGAGDTVNGLTVTQVWVNDTITVDMGGGPVAITGVTFYVVGGPAVFTPTDGTILSDATFVSSTYVTVSTQIPIADLAPPCFVRGTMILTPDGEVPVEDLRPGDLVVTLDHGAQALRWIGMSEVDASGEFAPVLIRAGALGNARELRVSPQHRILVQGWQAELYFGQAEVLVPAKHLVDGVGIVQEPGDSVCYFHLMFSQHELVTSDGVLSESFFPGDQVMLRDRAVRDELLALFPELTDITASRFAKTARATVRQREARVLVPAA